MISETAILTYIVRIFAAAALCGANVRPFYYLLCMYVCVYAHAHSGGGLVLSFGLGAPASRAAQGRKIILLCAA